MTITMDQILTASIIEVEKFLSPYLQPISESKLKHIQSYVASQAPLYRHLMKYMPKDIAQIKPNLTDEKLDDELHKIKRKFDNQVRTDNAKLLKDLNKGTISSEGYQKRFRGHIERVSTANSAVRAEYVAHRKVITDLLESAIRKNNDSGFEVESYLHNLIYPMRTTSTDLPAAQQRSYKAAKRPSCDGPAVRSEPGWSCSCIFRRRSGAALFLALRGT